MKRSLVLATLIFLGVLPSFAQTYRARRIQSFTTATAGSAVNLIGSGVSTSTITWNISGGTVSACQAKVEQSANGSSGWTDLIPNQTCTSNGIAAYVAGVPNYIRINVGTLTAASGTPAVTVNWTGYTAVPSSGPVASLNLTGQTTALGTTTVYAVPASGTGMYEVSVYLYCTAAGTGGNVRPQVTWNDGAATQILGLSATPIDGSCLSGVLDGSGQIEFPIYAVAGQNISVATTFSGVTGAPVYAIRVRVIPIG